MIQVKATCEGLIGDRTSSGYIIETHVPFVALPSTKALYRILTVINPLNMYSCQCICLDVGPWNIDDDAYVFQSLTSNNLGRNPPPGGSIVRPLSESGIKTDGRGHRISGETNKAGIDLGSYVWSKLGMKDNGDILWTFI